MIAALCVARNSIYKGLPGVDCYDLHRDVRTFDGNLPVVAHPPCRTWSAFTAHQAKAPAGEKDLGLLCAAWLRQCGGVLEHPAHCRLWAAARLPEPGTSSGDLWSVQVWQSWWGYSMKKATWLCFSKIQRDLVEFPYRLHEPRGDRRRQQVMSKNQRSATCPAFAGWLVDVAQKVTLWKS